MKAKSEKPLVLLIAVSVALMLASTAAYADAVDVQLQPSTVVVYQGATVTVDALISNPGNTTEYLNGANVNIGSVNPSATPPTGDDTVFLTTDPASVSSGTNWGGYLPLLDIAAPLGTSLGEYSVDFQILGGPTGASLGTLADFNFNVEVIPTPEPSSLLLLGTGLMGIAYTVRRKVCV